MGNIPKLTDYAAEENVEASAEDTWATTAMSVASLVPSTITTSTIPWVATTDMAVVWRESTTDAGE